MSDSSDRWKKRQDNKTGTSRQSSVKDRWPPADKENKTSRFTSSPKRETSRTAEPSRQKPPSGSSSTTSNSTRSSTATNSGQTNFSSTTNTSTHRSSPRSSKTSEHDMTQRNTTSKTHAPTAGSLASQSGESSAVGSDRKTHTSSESQTIPEPKQITVVESPTHLQQKTSFTTVSVRNPRNSSSSSSVASRKGTITISSRKTPSPELPASHHLSAQQQLSDSQHPPLPSSPRNLLPSLAIPLKSGPHISHSSHASQPLHSHHNITHVPDSPTDPHFNSDMSSGELTSSSLGDHSHGAPVTCTSGVKDHTNPNSLDGPCKMVGGFHSMEVDPHTGKPNKTPEREKSNLKELQEWERSTLSESTSSSTDKIVTLEGSIHLTEATRKIYSEIHTTTTPSPEQQLVHVAGQNRENWDDSLHVELGGSEGSERYNPRMVSDGGTMLSVASMTGKTGDQSGGGNKEKDKDEDDEKVKEKGAGNFYLKHVHASGAQGEGGVADKMLCAGGSFDIDEHGQPVTGACRHTHQVDGGDAEQKHFEKLQSELDRREAKIVALKEDSKQKKQLIETLQKVVEEDKTTAKKGIRGHDVDTYMERVIEMTKQLTALQDEHSKKLNYIAQLEQEAKQVGGASQSDTRMKQLEEENAGLAEQVCQLEKQVSKTGQTSHRETAPEQSNRTDNPPSIGYNQHRHLTDQLNRIPELEKQLESLKSQLKHAKSFRADAKEIQDQLLQQVERSSFLEQESKKLKDEIAMQSSQIASVEGLLEQTEQENEELKSLLKQSTSKSVISESQPPSTAEGESGVLGDSASEIVATLTAKIDQLEGELKHKDDMMQRLKERVAMLTVPLSDPKGSADDPQQDILQGSNRTAPQLSGTRSDISVGGAQNDTEVETLAQGSAPSDREGQHKKSKEEGSPQLKARLAALKVIVQERDEKVANVTRQLQSFTQTAEEFARIQKHSKKQSQVVADLKRQLEQQEKPEVGLTTALTESQDKIKELKSQQTIFDSTIRKLRIQKAELQQQVKTLTERGQEFATTKYQETERRCQQLEKIVTELQSTVETLQDEKKGLVEKLGKMSVLEERRDHLEQVVVNQQAVIANDRQALQDSQARATELAKDKDDLENQLVRIMKEKTEILSEVEVHKFAAETFQEDFESERKDREKAHSQFANMEAQCAQQVETLTKKLEDTAREREALRGTLKETESKYQNQISALRNQTDGLREQVANVEDEVQSRTQQGKQYKKMIDSYKDELAMSREQAEAHKKQIEMFAVEAESYKKLNEALCHEVENLKARERHTAAIHGGLSTRGTVPAAELQKEKTRREEVEKCCLKLEKMYDDLSVKFVMLTSENDQYKKQLGLQRDQSPQSSAAAGAYNPNIQRGGLTTAGGQGRLGQHTVLPNQPPIPSAKSRLPPKAASVDSQVILNSRGQVDQSHSRNPVPTPRNLDSNVPMSHSDDPARHLQSYGMQYSSNVVRTSGQPSLGSVNREGRPHTSMLGSLQTSGGFNAQGARQSRDDLHLPTGGGLSHPQFSSGGNYNWRGQSASQARFQHTNADGPRASGIDQSDSRIANTQGINSARNNAPVTAGPSQYMPRTEHAQYYHNIPGPGTDMPTPSGPASYSRYTSPSHHVATSTPDQSHYNQYQQQVKPDIHVMGIVGGPGNAMGRYSEDTVEKDSPPSSLGFNGGAGTGSSGPRSLNPQMLDSYQSQHQAHLQAQSPRRSSHQPVRGGQSNFGNGGNGVGLQGMGREPHVSSHDQQRLQQLNRQQFQHILQQQHPYQQQPAGRVQAGIRAGGTAVRGSSSPSLLPSSAHLSQQTPQLHPQPHGVDVRQQQPIHQHSSTAELSLRMKQQQPLHHASSGTGTAAHISSGLYAPHTQSSQHVPKCPTQESSALSESSQSQLPSAIRNQSQNVYSPPHNQPSTKSSATGRGVNPSKFTEESSSSNLDNSRNGSFSASNNLESGIDSDIRQAATIVKKQVEGRDSIEGGHDNAPFDPNLICPTCMTQFRIGEIQKFRKHAASCIKE